MPHWQTIGPQPNADAVKAWRRNRLQAARQKPLADRIGYLASLAKGKKVLDIGVVDHDASEYERADWLHQHIAKASESCLGVDVIEDQVEYLKRAGYQVRCCDITDPAVYQAMEERFDLIVCGELVEHLSAPGRLFDAASHLLEAGGRLVMTTPNPFCIWTMYRHLRGRGNDSVDHVFIAFPSGMAELAERSGLALTSWRGTQIAATAGNHKAVHALRPLLCLLMVDEALCTTMIYEFTRE